MWADGIELFLDDTVVEARCSRSQGGQTARLQSGRSWEFDTLIEAVGVTPTFPEVDGLNVGRGIQIDEQCRTNLPDIYAAGDCTETRAPGGDRWRITRIWLDCARQGKTAGRNMAADRSGTGRAQALPRTPFYNASLIYTVFYAYIGEPHGAGGEIHTWQEGDGYRKVRVRDGALTGTLLLGERRGSTALLAAIGRPVADYGSRIAHPDFPFNDLTGKDWDYLWY
jgi:NADPH-dependent 2,4-dienoyl-CoA reductase/sulfur reductase-like enzyme